MIIEDEDFLKKWIMKDVTSLTDADADRLALYVIALLKKPLSGEDLVELCLDKLDVFLQNHTKEFVDRLFDTMKDGSYLPETAQTTGIDDLILTDGSDQEEEAPKSPSTEEKNLKSSFDKDSKPKYTIRSFASGDGKLSNRGDSKKIDASSRSIRRRISPPNSERDSNRYGRDSSARSPVRNRRGNASHTRNSRSDRHHRRRSYSRSRSGSVSRTKSGSRSPHREKRRDEHEISGRRHRCRDFHEKGFCMRGDKCVYDHGPDPVVIENAALEKIVSRANTTTSSIYSASNPPPPGVDRAFGGVSETYNPEAPGLTAAPGITPTGKIDFTVPPPPLPSHLIQSIPFGANVASSSALVTVVPNVQPFNATIPSSALAGIPQDPSLSSNYMFGNGTKIVQHPQGFVTRRGAGRGRFKPYGSTPRVNPALCSLLVKKIPPEQNKIVQLDQHFGKFGQITNLHVQYEGQPDTALVTFKTRREALNAYKSTEPIFNNRFIKVYWQTQPPEAENNEAVSANNDGSLPNAPNPSGVSLAPGMSASNCSQQPDISVPTNLNRPFSKTFTHSHAETVPDLPVEKPVSEENNEEKQVAALPFSENASEPTQKRPIYNPRALAAKRKAEKENLMRMVDVHRRKTELYQQQIDQQKSLLQKIQATDNRELKKKYMELVKKIEVFTKTSKDDIESLSQKIAVLREKLEKEQLSSLRIAKVRTSRKTETDDEATNELVVADPESIVPDGERKPSEQVTPAALLASLGEDEEEDDDADGDDDDDDDDEDDDDDDDDEDNSSLLDDGNELSRTENDF